MKKNNNDFESMGKSIMGKIYPYIINDLKNYYIEDFDKKSILEIGTGPGFILKELLKEKFSKIYGIDLSLDMLSRANKNINIKNHNIQLINAKAESLPFKENSIDIIISRGSIFFWKDITSAIKEINRIIRTNGFVIIGGGYGISTPDSIIDEIKKYYFNNIKKNDKPKLNIDDLTNIISNFGYKPNLVFKPKHGFWIYWKKSKFI